MAGTVGMEPTANEGDEMKLAEALLLRKQLANKVEQLKPIRAAGDQGLFELKTQRVKVSDEYDEVKLQIPRVSFSDLTATFDFYATQLRKIDSAIQQANWTCEIDFSESEPPKMK